MKTMLQFMLGSLVLVYVPVWVNLLLADFVESRKSRVPEPVHSCETSYSGATPDCVRAGVEYDNTLPPTFAL